MANINNAMNNLNINPAPNAKYDRQQYEVMLQTREAVQEHIENIRENMNNALRHPYLYPADFYQVMAEELLEYAAERTELTRQMNEIVNRARHVLILPPDPSDPATIATPAGIPSPFPPLPNNASGSGLYSKYKRRRQV